MTGSARKFADYPGERPEVCPVCGEPFVAITNDDDPYTGGTYFSDRFEIHREDHWLDREFIHLRTDSDA